MLFVNLPPLFGSKGTINSCFSGVFPLQAVICSAKNNGGTAREKNLNYLVFSRSSKSLDVEPGGPGCFRPEGNKFTFQNTNNGEKKNSWSFSDTSHCPKSFCGCFLYKTPAQNSQPLLSFDCFLVFFFGRPDLKGQLSSSWVISISVRTFPKNNSGWAPRVLLSPKKVSLLQHTLPQVEEPLPLPV